MADDGFKGSTISFGGDQTPLRSITYALAADAVEVGGSADPQKLYVTGREDETITFEIVGVTALTTQDAAAAVTIAWNDGSSDAFTTGVIVGVDIGGGEGSEILSSITCKRAS